MALPTVRKSVVVVAAGGDGTLGDLVNALAGRGLDVPVGFLPAGTANVFALEAGLPRTDDQLAAFLLTAPARPYLPGLGRFTGPDGRPAERLFMLMAGAGFDARVTGAVNHRLKRWHGRGAYVLAGALLLLARRGERLVVTADGEDLEGDLAVAAVSRFYGGRWSLVPAAAPTKPGLSLAVVGRVTPATLPRLVAAAARGVPDRSGNIRYRDAAEVAVAAPGHPVQMDGDPVGTTPAVFRRADRPVAVVAGGSPA
jgi:diacylglycerol kinase family enzyme